MTAQPSAARCIYTLAITIFILFPTLVRALSMYSRYDPFPMFTSLDPQSFVYTTHELKLLNYETEKKSDDRAHIAISAYGQNADSGKNACGDFVELGDLTGRWDMITLLYGPTPAGATLPPALISARQTLFPDVALGTPINDACSLDPNQQAGFFSVPLNYRKRGVRFQLEAQLTSNVGFRAETGLADISQKVCPSVLCPCTPEEDNPLVHCGKICPGFRNLTPDNYTNTYNANVTTSNINCALMQKLSTISQQINFNLDNFHRFSVEDIRLMLYWRHAYLMNEGRSHWPKFLFMPYALIEGDFAVGKPQRRNHAFDLSFGNSDFNALGFTAGMTGNFAKSIELAWEFGYKHFFAKDFCNMPMPTSIFQQGIFPFQTDVCLAPGDNWHFAAKMAAYHFVDRLSFYFQYVLVNHDNDSYKLKTPDPAFLPAQLENRSFFRSQVANIGFNYDVSPYISLGFLWQAPLQETNAYRTTTIMFSFNATF